MTRWQLMAETFVELAASFDDVDLPDFFHHLVARSVEITGSAAAGLILADGRGGLALVASTDHAAEVLATFAVATAEGPCVDVVASGTAIVGLDAAEAELRWPRYQAAARRGGFVRSDVVPMRVHSEVCGALSVLYTRTHGLEADESLVLEALAAVAAIGLIQESAERQRDRLSEHLQDALHHLVSIEQAKGMVAEACGVDPAAAFDLIRAYSARTSTRLGATAEGLVSGELDPSEMGTAL